MNYFRKRKLNVCWWCDSKDLTAEHKSKKTDLEILYGKTYKRKDQLVLYRYANPGKKKNLQSSNSKSLRFEENLCKQCNNQKSQKFDFAYQKLIEYYLENYDTILNSHQIDLENIFGDNWADEFLNVKRYITKHIGCRLAELGYRSSKEMIEFLDGSDKHDFLKIVFQLKPYHFGTFEEPVHFIFLGPFNPINKLPFKVKGLVTSFSGWYSIANFTWNYLIEKNVQSINHPQREIKLHFVGYEENQNLELKLTQENLLIDSANAIDKLEYYPFLGRNKDIEHYKWIKRY